MPLKGTKREQKHYREIREKYPEKGKEYAARVARNIVRANTSGGRKLKGTTEYGRKWGPPYSQPLSKKGELMDFYKLGQDAALEKVGFGGLIRAGKAIGGVAREAGGGLRDIWGGVGGGKGVMEAARGGREGLRSMWAGLAPEQQALLKQLGAGAAVGGVGGGIAGGQMGGTGGAIAGALGGAGLGAIGGRRLGTHLMQRGEQAAMAARKAARGDVAQSIKEQMGRMIEGGVPAEMARTEARRAMPGALRSVEDVIQGRIGQMRGQAFPIFGYTA